MSAGADPSAPRTHDPGLAGDRTALAWTRSALSIAVTGVLTARAAFAARLGWLGVISGLAMAALSIAVYRHALSLYPGRRLPGPLRHDQAGAFQLLTAVTLATAAVAIIVVLAIA